MLSGTRAGRTDTKHAASDTLVPVTKPEPLDQLRDVLRRRHYALATDKSYVGWCRRLILFQNKRHPNEMGEGEIRAFLTHMTVESRVTARGLRS